MRRSKQSLSHYHLVTGDMGQLLPIGMIPVLPGDRIGHQTNLFIRLSPQFAPVMHQVDARVHHFYIANRTIWDGWEDFITGGEDGMNTATVPTITNSTTAGTVLDCLGVKPGPQVDINALPVRALNAVYNEFYRDQDLQTERLEDDITIPNICWGKDYETTARPFSAKGPSVTIPIGNQAPVTAESINVETGAQPTGGGQSTVRRQDNQQTFTQGSQMFADLSAATGADPIEVRRAWGLQRFMEEAAQYGSRYPEKMRRLGSRYQGLLERPEFLGGGSRAIQFSEVIQNANDTTDRTGYGVGDLYGHAIAATRSNRYARRIDEHGYVLSFLSVRPQGVYQDGVEREWLKLDREDFHDPFLEDIGMQTVYNGEIALDHVSGHKGTFGFSDRYQEYRGAKNKITKEFRDVFDYWHLARDLPTNVTLNSDFVTCTPSKRIFQEQTQNSMWCMAHHQIAVYRNISARMRTRVM